jgi:ribose transport system permease protein
MFAFLKKKPGVEKKHRRILTTEILLLAVLILMAIGLGSLSSKFLTPNNLFNLVRQTSIYGVVAIGMTVVIISAGIDLSVGAVVGLSGILVSSFMTTGGMSVPLAIITGVLLATLIGLFNGIVIFDGKVPAFIATLGSMTAVRGLVMLTTNARMVAGLPKSFTGFAQSTILGLPGLTVIWLIIIVITALMLKFTTFGRNIYAIGSNIEAARLSGINIRLTTYGVYTFGALLSAIAGVMMTARLGNGVPTGGMGYETDAIASAVIGGASLSGAEGTIIGTVLGSIIMQTLRNGGNLLGINPFIMEIVIGLLIIGAVMLDKRRAK